MATRLETATQILGRALYDAQMIGSEIAMVPASKRKRLKEWVEAREEFERKGTKLLLAMGIVDRLPGDEITGDDAASAAGRVLAVGEIELLDRYAYAPDDDERRIYLAAFIKDAKTAAASALTQKPDLEAAPK